MVQEFTDIVCYNIKPVQKGNTTNRITFQIQDPNVPNQLAGAEITMNIKARGLSAPIKTLSSMNTEEIEISNAAEGSFIIKPFLCDIVPGTHSYLITIKYSETYIKTRFKGTYEVYG